MPKFKHEQRSPGREQVLEKAVSAGAQKIKTMITNPDEKFRVTPDVIKKSIATASDMKKKYNVEVKTEAILEKSLEMLNIQEGVLSENLQENYTDLIAARMADKVAEGKDIYELLKEEGFTLKKKGIDLDFEKIEEKMRRKLAA